MRLKYLVKIVLPEVHTVDITIYSQREKGQNRTKFIFPTWTPGSYLIREYSRNVQELKIASKNGKPLYFKQLSKNEWEIQWDHPEFTCDELKFEVSYKVYAHENTVRTAHIDGTHAFLHGPALYMYQEGRENEEIEIELRFPALWSKVATGLENIGEGSYFLYKASDLDELLDSPIEIGCHESDGFLIHGVEHHLAFKGPFWGDFSKIKDDLSKICEHICSIFEDDIPFKNYHFITHFSPGIYGGLEHLNSTVLQYCSYSLRERKGYLDFLVLAAHEYFHAWNVKRIRPKELGPFDYEQENYTEMLWLAEGLTTFMDIYIVYKCGLMSEEEFFDYIKDSINQLESCNGRKFHSLEQSSFNAWIKLYRPDENTKNSSVSYYLKGSLVMMALHLMYVEKGMGIHHFCMTLWNDYKARPDRGITKDEVIEIIKNDLGDENKDEFLRMIETTEDIDFATLFKKHGIGLKYFKANERTLGITPKFEGDRVIIKSLDRSYKNSESGFAPGDEILCINGLRILKGEFTKIGKLLKEDEPLEVMISREGVIATVYTYAENLKQMIQKLETFDKNKSQKAF